MDEIAEVLTELHAALLNEKNFVRAVFSGRRRNMEVEFERIDIRPVSIKNSLQIQMSYSDGRQMTTKNFPFAEFPFMKIAESGYANILIESIDSAISLRFSKKDKPLVTRSNHSAEQVTTHNHIKTRLLQASDPFLLEVGIADAKGNIKPSMMDKYKQVEEFLRLLVPTLEDAIKAGHIAPPTKSQPLKVVDLGCGHAYLTFAAHQYLKAHSIPVSVIGIDVRESSRIRNIEIATRLGISDSINFLAEEISQTSVSDADVAIALHACDTATDDAIAWAVNAAVPLTLFAPCCHHDIQSQMKVAPEPWSLLTRHGIMRERLGDLITDALRMQLMKLNGYRVEAIEFIGGVHTPRNLMIRAVRTGAKAEPADTERYREMVDQWGVNPVLEGKLNR